jgi:hypothetical protein
MPCAQTSRPNAMRFRRELAEARAELYRLKILVAADRAEKQEITRQRLRNPLSVSAAQSMSASLRKRPKCCVAAN